MNGLDIETQHVKVRGIMPMGYYYYIFPTVTAGVDVWMGLNIAYGKEGAGDQASDVPIVTTGLPATFDVMDQILAGEMTAEEYADWAAPRVLEEVLSHPEFPAVEQRLMDAHAKAIEEGKTEEIKMFKAEVKKRYGYEVKEITPELVRELAPFVVKDALVTGAFPAITDLLQSVQDITPADFRFASGTWDIEQLVNAVKVLDAVQKSGDAELIADAQKIIGRLVQDQSGQFTVQDLNTVLADLNALDIPSDIKPEYVYVGDATIGIFWFGLIFPFEEAHMYYKQITLPLPISIPGFGVIPRITATFAMQVPPVYFEFTDIRLDPLALPLTLPLYKAPLAGLASTGKEMTVSTVVFNLGFETGQAVVSEKLPADWKMDGGSQGIIGGLAPNSACTIKGCTINLPPLSYAVVSYDTEVPARNAVGVEQLLTHIDSFDIDEGERGGSGQAGDTSYNNANEVLAFLGVDPALIFSATSYVVTKPLDVILIEEANGEDALAAGAAGYAEGKAVVDAAGFGDAADGTLAEAVVDDPRAGSEATVNDALNEVVNAIRGVRYGLLDLVANGGSVGPVTGIPGTGTDAYDTITETGLVEGDVDRSVRGVENLRVALQAPASPTGAYADRVFGDGVRITKVSTPQELADHLAGVLTAAQTGGLLELVNALPSTVAVLSASPGFGGGTVVFETSEGPVPVPGELLVDILNMLGIGLVQDADGFATNPWLFSPASGTVTGAATSGLVDVSGGLQTAPSFALVDGSPKSLGPIKIAPAFTVDATFGQDVNGVFKATGTETGAADVAASGASAGLYLTGADASSEADQTTALNHVLYTAAVNYGDMLLATEGSAARLQGYLEGGNTEGATAEAHTLRGIGQDAAGSKAILVPSGAAAVGTFRLGFTIVQNVEAGSFVIPVMLQTDGRATVIGPDVQTGVGDWDSLLTEATADSGFALALSIPWGVEYAPIFG